MKTLDQILTAAESGDIESCLDGRNFSRLAEFLPVSEWHRLGLKPVENFDPSKHTPKAFTRENVIAQLREDVDFGFEKALNKRGISSGLMYETVKMWVSILEDEELAKFRDYAQYGPPFFKAVAVKHGFQNPIGEDRGDEEKYAA